MKYKILATTVLAILFFLVVVMSTSPDSENTVLGYCPTMDLYAESLDGFERVEFESARYVMEALSNGEVDVGLIGRKAYVFERTGFYEEMLKPGYTLVGSEREIVRCGELEELRIGSLKELDYPYSDYEKFDSLNAALESADAVLIEWEDFECQELVIPVCNGEKMPWFRTPHVYSEKEYFLEKFK